MIARLREKQFMKAVGVMKEYAVKYDWKERVDEQKKIVCVRLDCFPESAARMMLLSLFQDPPFTADYLMEITIGNNTSAIVKLLAEDLLPRIPYHIKGNTMCVQYESIIGWSNRKRLCVC